ncbi:hypothetical protein C0431_01205 [bacterium]|nr:hypothetical protein [bacterium]
MSRPRVIAEWEPALGTMVTWPFEIPEQLVTDLANGAKLFVLVENEKETKAAEKQLKALGLKSKSFELVRTSSKTQWTRDWGPHQLVDSDGRRALVDHIFKGYPWVPADTKVTDLKYFSNGLGDDLATAELASHFKTWRVEIPAILTGGNLLVDGKGRAFCTHAMLVENEPLMDQDKFRRLLLDKLGISDLVVLENTEKFGIQHIDCWLKLLNEETLLVKRVPVDHFEHDPLERNVERLSALRAPSGKPYRIIRIDCPRIRQDEVPAYTNSLILNRVVHVPLFGIEADKQALKTYASALPGYTIKGYVYKGWMHFDALHCRTRALFKEP